MATFNKNTIFWDTAGSGSGYNSFRYVSSNGTRHTYARYGPSGTIDATNTISYDESDKKWRDENPSDHPGGFVMSTTLQSNPSNFFSTSPATGTANAEYIHVSNHYGAFWFAFQMAGWSSSSGGANTLSGGSSPEIADVAFIKVTDTIVYLSFNWQNLNTAFLFVDSGGTVTQTNISLGGQGQSGTVASSGFLTNMSEGDRAWIANTDAEYIHKIVEWSYDRSTKKVVAKAFFVDNGGNGFGQNADVALVRMMTPTYGAFSLLDAQADPTNGYANHDGTLKTLTLDAKPGSRWAITNIDTSQYGSSYRVPATKVFCNFW